MDVPAIEATDLHKSYADNRALNGVTFEVGYGTVFAYLGRNGAGKTTTVRLLTGLSAATSGTARVGGRTIGEWNPEVGVTMQAAALDPMMTGREHLELVAALWGFKRQALVERVDSSLERFGLGDAANDLVRTYSGGMKRRLDLAGALLHFPRILFLDEPTTGLDAQSRRALWDEVRMLRDDGSAIFLTTQYLEEAEQLADRVAILHEGSIAAQGTPDELRRRMGGVELVIGVDDPSQTGRATVIAGRLARVDAHGVARIPVANAGEAVDLLDEARRKFAIGSARIDSPTLEDVFLAVTGRSVTATAPGLEPVA